MLVTGVARQLGGRFVRRIQRDPQVDRVIAVDAVLPEHHLGEAEFVEADIRQPTIARVLAEHSVDTVVHMDVTGIALGGGSRTTVKETNVIGTMQLLGACQKSPSVKRLVVKSSTNVYGLRAAIDPAVFTETTPPKSLPSGGFAKDTVEVEGMCVASRGGGPTSPCGAVREHPRAERRLAARLVLRAAGAADRLRLRPTAAVRARGRCDRGTADRLPRSTARHAQQRHLQHRRRRRPVALAVRSTPGPSHGASAAAGAQLGGHGGAYPGSDGLLAEQLRLLTHGRVVSTNQMRETLGYKPRYSTAETFADFARSRGPGLLPPRPSQGAVDRDQPRCVVGGGHPRH